MLQAGCGGAGGPDWRPPATFSKNASARDSKLFLLKLSGMHKTYPCSNMYKGHGFTKCAAARASHHEESNPTAHAAGQLVGDSNVKPTCSRFVLRESCDPDGPSPKAASSAPSGDSLRRRPATSTACGARVDRLPGSASARTGCATPSPVSSTNRLPVCW